MDRAYREFVMNHTRNTFLFFVLWASALVAGTHVHARGAAPGAPLPSWNQGDTRRAVIDFVAAVTDPASPDFVPRAERIAVFDNDGTLWSEKPVYFQLFFALDRLRELAPQHPEWADTQPFKAALEGDFETLGAGGVESILEIVMATHATADTDEFAALVRKWIESAQHPTREVPFPQLVFQPMLELLSYLRANGFTTYIVSGGGQGFMRAFAEELYGVPPEQVIGSVVKTEFVVGPDGPDIRRVPQIEFIDDEEGKPIAIERVIGRRPIAAFGNSDGDLEMLQWTAAGGGRRLCALVHHTDAEREWAYDRDSSVGRLDEALDQARQKGWTVIDMKNDWSTVFVRNAGGSPDDPEPRSEASGS
jgi:phosphoserine phosphatase